MWIIILQKEPPVCSNKVPMVTGKETSLQTASTHHIAVILQMVFLIYIPLLSTRPTWRQSWSQLTKTQSSSPGPSLHTPHEDRPHHFLTAGCHVNTVWLLLRKVMQDISMLSVPADSSHFLTWLLLTCLTNKTEPILTDIYFHLDDVCFWRGRKLLVFGICLLMWRW